MKLNLILTTLLLSLSFCSHSQKLYNAVEKGNLKRVKAIVKRGADVNELSKEGFTALWRAAVDGNFEIGQHLIENGAKVHKDCAPLRIAARKGDFDIVKLLVENGAELDFKTLDGSTALARAASRGHLETVSYLISKGADVNAVDKSGNTALSEAAVGGYLEIINELIKAGANLDHMNKKNQSIVDIANMNGRYKAVELLIANRTSSK